MQNRTRGLTRGLNGQRHKLNGDREEDYTEMMRKLGGCWVKNRLRKWSTGSYAAQCLRRSLAEHTPVAEDEVV